MLEWKRTAIMAVVAAVWGLTSAPVAAMPRTAIEVIQILATSNPDKLFVRDDRYSTDIIIGSNEDVPDPKKMTGDLELQTAKLGDELAAALQQALKDKGIVNYIAGADQHPWPTASLQLSIDDLRYERRLEGKIGPNLLVRFKLYDANNSDKLTSNTYTYDMYAKTIGRTVLRPPAEYGFDTREELHANHGKILAAMRTGMKMIAEQIVTDILAEVEN